MARPWLQSSGLRLLAWCRAGQCPGLLLLQGVPAVGCQLPASIAHLAPAMIPLRSVVVEGKNVNAAFVPFRLVNYLCPAPASLAAAVAEVAELICQEDKYEASEWLQIAASACGAQVSLV